MAKSKTVYVCNSCGYNTPKWVGQCPSCKAWNTLEEELKTSKPKFEAASAYAVKPQKLSEIEFGHQSRFSTQIKEFDRVLGGGMVPGALVLVGGEPGIGKSTLALQSALLMKGKRVLYISGEESAQQVRMRAERLSQNVTEMLILPETKLENILHQLKEQEADFVVLDSIQTVYSEKLESSPGTVSQIRECTNELLTFSKNRNTTILLVGHITKDGSIAGPKVLEHMVDTVLQFEGDRNHVYRILRANKNRFGSTSEIGIFEMQQSGLREVSNPSELLLSNDNENLSGIAVAASIEGARPLLIETQALVSSAVFGTPQRSSTGFDLRRLNMLLAVLEKRMGFRLAQKDVFLNIAGGLKVDDPAVDLAIVASVFSSDLDLPIPSQTTFAGEVGLSGEIRTVQRIEQRVAEAEKLGFKEMFLPRHAAKQLSGSKKQIQLHFVSRVDEVLRHLFGKR